MPQLGIVIDIEQHGFDAMRELYEQHPDAQQTSDLVDVGVVIHLDGDAHLEVGALAHGMASGDPSVMFCYPLPDGRVVLAETSLRLLLSAADALKAVHGDPRMADLSMPNITLPPDFPPRALIRAAISAVELARDSVQGATFDLLRRTHNLLKRADQEEARRDG